MSIAQVETKKKLLGEEYDRQTDRQSSDILCFWELCMSLSGLSALPQRPGQGPWKKNSIRDSGEKEKKRSVGCDDRKGEKDRWAS